MTPSALTALTLPYNMIIAKDPVFDGTNRKLSSGQPAYLRELISPYQPSRSLRSSNQLLLTVPRANLTQLAGALSPIHSSPVIWNERYSTIR